MIKLNHSSLMTYLKSQNFDAQVQAETQQLYYIVNLEGKEFPFFLKTDGLILQLLVFMPCSITASSFGDLARLLHLLNKEMDLPGFGMDEKGAVVFYRCVVPTTNGEVEETLLKTHLISMSRVAHLFFP